MCRDGLPANDSKRVFTSSIVLSGEMENTAKSSNSPFEVISGEIVPAW
jgi:hypothetical protein